MITGESSTNSATSQIESNHLEEFPEIGILEKYIKSLKRASERDDFLVQLQSQGLQLYLKSTHLWVFFKNFAKNLQTFSLYFKNV